MEIRALTVARTVIIAKEWIITGSIFRWLFYKGHSSFPGARRYRFFD